MNKLRKSIISLLILWAPSAAHAGPTAYALQVDGLACPFCAYGIEKKLSTIEGVKDIQVDIKKGRVVVITSDGATLSEEIAREKVKKAGFSLRGFAQIKGGE